MLTKKKIINFMRMSRTNVWLAYFLGNRRGKREDCYGRSYRQTYRDFGNKAMAGEFLYPNSWNVKQRVGLI